MHCVLRDKGGVRNCTILNVHPVTDLNEVTMHGLDVIHTHLSLTRRSPQVCWNLPISVTLLLTNVIYRLLLSSSSSSNSHRVGQFMGVEFMALIRMELALCLVAARWWAVED